MEQASFSIRSISISPEVSPLASPVKIVMDWQSPHALSNAVWKAFYQIDTIRKRKLFEVLSLAPSDFAEGLNTLDLDIPSIEVDLNVNINAGVLLLTLSSENEELLAINMIVLVMQKEGTFFKTIFSPLE